MTLKIILMNVKKEWKVINMDLEAFLKHMEELVNKAKEQFKNEKEE